MTRNLAHHNLPNFKEVLKAKWFPKISSTNFKKVALVFFRILKKIEELLRTLRSWEFSLIHPNIKLIRYSRVWKSLDLHLFIRVASKLLINETKQQFAHHNLPNFKEALKAKWCPKISIRILEFGRFSVRFCKN